MSTQTEAMKRWVEVFDGNWHDEPVDSEWADRAHQALAEMRQAIAEAEQPAQTCSRHAEAERLADQLEDPVNAKLYLAPYIAAELRRLVSFNQQLMDEVARLQKREWVGLTDEQVIKTFNAICNGKPFSVERILELHRAIEAELKEKNT